MPDVTRICFPTLRSSAVQGSNTSALYIGRYLDRFLFEPLYVYRETGPAFDKALEYGMDAELVPISVVAEKFKHFSESGNPVKRMFLFALYLPYLIRVIIFIKRRKVNLIHANDLLTALIWGLAGKAARVPVVWHVRQYKSSRFLDRIRLWASSHVIFVANQNKSKFPQKILDRAPHSTVYNGVDTQLFCPKGSSASSASSALLHDISLPHSARVVGFFGVLTARKRPEFFVDACLALMNEFTDLHILIAGADSKKEPEEISYRAYLEQKIVSLPNGDKLLSRFHFLGHQPNPHLLMRDLDILLFTSEELGEAFPRVVIEAMACGIPVVATRSAGVPEAVVDGQTGFLVAPDDKNALIEKALQLLGNSKRMRVMGLAGRKRAVELFDAQACSKKIEAIYKTLLPAAKFS